MPEYVYALYDFLPEHEDEASFHSGERIEVIEKDDLYVDGWWHGRTLAGGVGLFPVSYTAPVPPTTKTFHVLPSPGPVSESSGISTSSGKFVLQPLAEESESEASGINIQSPVSKHPTTSLLIGDYDNELSHEGEASHNLVNGNSETMKPPMTVLQKAIEQLGRDDVGEEGDARGFSFASTRDGANAEISNDTDFDGTGINGNDDNGEDWNKGARRKLAAKVKQVVEEAEKLEAMGYNENGRRALAPAIEVDFSDESEVEDDADLMRSSNFQRNHPHIPEGEDVGTNGKVTATTNGTRYSTIDTLSNADVLVPQNDETDIPTATKHYFSASQTPIPTTELLEEPEKKLPAPEKDIYPSPISPSTTNVRQILKGGSTPAREISDGLPSASVGHVNSKPNSMTSSSSASGMLMNALQVQQQPNSTSVSTKPTSVPVSTTVLGRNGAPPMMEWSVKEVVDWLKRKGFDQDVCDKFIEQEITGDVLLELDVNLLKSEIGIMAFGKRMRIANAITDFRRPPSIEYSDHQLSPTQLRRSNSLTHSHSRSQSRSLPLPERTSASTVGRVHWQSSFGSPGAGYGGQQSRHLQDSQVNINDDMKVVRPVSGRRRTAVDVAASMSAAAGIGLGIKKGPPSTLLLSRTLKESVAKTVSAVAVNGEDEERGHMSDSAITLNSTTLRRRIFGLSHESAISIMSSSSRSKDTSDKDTPTIGIRRTRSGKSVDVKPADRLSIIGTSFGGTLGKGRKPPPSEDTLTEKTSKFSLPKLHTSSSIHRSSSTASHRLSTSNGSLQKGPNEFIGMYDEKEKISTNTNLRERTTSDSNPNVSTGINANAPENVNGVSGFIDQEVNDQIGEPDHTGWMRMRGDKLNSWKSHYFILKGPYLYFSRSNHNSGYIHLVGYKVTVDENVDPGRYGLRIDHDHDETHYFSSEERSVTYDWMRAIMKATILRDYTKPVVSSCDIPTVSLVVAQAMNPAPRPPSPSTCEATQRALRRENTEQLSARDTAILGLNVMDFNGERARLDSVFSNAVIAEGESNPSSPKASAPPRPFRQSRRMDSGRTVMSQADDSLIKWVNTHLPESLQITPLTGFLCTGLGLLRLAESIKGQPSSPPVPDSAFPADIHDEKLDGLFMLFDFLLANDVKMGSVSINDVRLGKRDKIFQLLKALKAWDDKLKALDLSITRGLRATSPAAFMLM